MINAFSVLNGYTIIRGSFNVQMAMFISMLVYLNPYWGDSLPSEEEFDWSLPGGDNWIHYGLWMHLLLASMQLWQMLNIPILDKLQTIRFVLQICSVIAQVLNFCLISRLYAFSPPMETLSLKLQFFETWLVCESFMVIFTFIALIVFLFFRAISSGKFEVVADGAN